MVARALTAATGPSTIPGARLLARRGRAEDEDAAGRHVRLPRRDARRRRRRAEVQPRLRAWRRDVAAKVVGHQLDEGGEEAVPVLRGHRGAGHGAVVRVVVVRRLGRARLGGGVRGGLAGGGGGVVPVGRHELQAAEKLVRVAQARLLLALCGREAADGPEGVIVGRGQLGAPLGVDLAPRGQAPVADGPPGALVLLARLIWREGAPRGEVGEEGGVREEGARVRVVVGS